MQKDKKILTALAAGVAAISPATNCVQAIENIDQSKNEKENKEKIVKEALEQNVANKEKEVNRTQKKLDSKTFEVEEASRALKEKKIEKQKVSVDFNVVQSEAETYITSKTENNQASIEEAQGEIDELCQEKERLEQEIQNFTEQKNQLEKERETLQKKYDELSSDENSNKLKQQIEKQTRVLEETNKRLNQASKEYNEIAEKYEGAINNINQLKEQKQQKKLEVLELEKKLEEQEASIQDVQNNLNDIQIAYNASVDESTKSKLTEELNNATLEYNDILKEYNSTKNNLSERQNSLVLLEAELKNAENENKDIMSKYNSTKKKLTEIQKEKETAEKNLVEVQASIDGVNSEIIKLKDEIESKKNLVDNLNKSTEGLFKLVETTKSAYEAVLAQWNKGSFGFYDSIGDEQAKDIINEGVSLGTTNLGNYNDATNLDNMKNAISLMLECNKLRVQNGLSELNTSALLMAISQVKLNHSCYQEDQTGDPHTGLYGTGENLASGYDITESDEDYEGKGPYSGWYGWQKQLLNEFYESHPEEKEKSIFETLVDYPDLYDSIKDYLNILSQEYTVSGSAYIPKQDEDSLNNFAQEFAWTSQYVVRDGIESVTEEGKMYNTAVGQMQAATFKEQFDIYYNKLVQELSSKKVAYENAKKAVGQATVNGTTLADAKKAYDDACLHLQELNFKKERLNSSFTVIRQNITNLNITYNNEKDTLDKLKNKVKGNDKSLLSTKEQYENLKDDISAKKALLEELQNRAVESNEAVEKINNILNNADLPFQILEEQRETLKILYSSQRKNFDSTLSSIDEIKNEISKIDAQCNEKQTKANKLQEELDISSCQKEDVQKRVNVQKQKLEDLKSKKEEINNLLDELLKNQELQKEIIKNIEKNKDVISECDEIITPLQERENKFLKETTRLSRMKILYDEIVDGISLSNEEDISLTNEEKELFGRLKLAAQNLKSVQNVLSDAQVEYESKKHEYDMLFENLEKAKLDYMKAQYALDEYLASKGKQSPAESTQPKPEKTQSKKEAVTPSKVENNIPSSDEEKNVETGISSQPEKYIATAGAAGAGYLLLRKKRKY